MRCLTCPRALRGRFEILSRAAIFAVFVLSVPLVSLPAQGQEREIGYDDSWHYRGEVEPKPAAAEPCLDIPCDRVCDRVYCAHGTGSYGTDGGESYTGEFRHGFMHGVGKYSSDWVSYVGEFAKGAFDGEGTLECAEGPVIDGRMTDGPTFKGRFTAGFMDGPFEVSGHVEVFSHVPVGPVFPPDLGYKRGRDYASTPCPE